MADLPTEGRIRRLSIRFQSVVADRDSDLTIALIALIARAGADVTVVYRLDAEAGQFHAVARQASSPEYIPDFEVTLSVSASQRLEGLTEPVQGKTSQNVLFEELPEIIRRGLGRTLVVPILGVEGLLGIVTLGQPAIATSTRTRSHWRSVRRGSWQVLWKGTRFSRNSSKGN